MGGFEASEESLQAASAQLDRVHVDIESDFAPVRRQLESLLDGSWQGGAARGFGACWDEWLAGFTESMTALASMSALLNTTGVDYGEAESTSTSVINGSGSSLL